jgi:hypothetical protein
MVISRKGINYLVPDQVSRETQLLLRERGRVGQEGYLVWVGDIGAISATVHEVWPVAADGREAHARVPIADALALAERVRSRGLYILAQIHSHPMRAFHSGIDDSHAISSQLGFISIVVGNFARDDPWDDWAVFEHMGGGRWQQLQGAELGNRIQRARVEEVWWRRLLAGIIGQRSS